MFVYQCVGLGVQFMYYFTSFILVTPWCAHSPTWNLFLDPFFDLVKFFFNFFFPFLEPVTDPSKPNSNLSHYGPFRGDPLVGGGGGGDGGDTEGKVSCVIWQFENKTEKTIKVTRELDRERAHFKGIPSLPPRANLLNYFFPLRSDCFDEVQVAYLDGLAFVSGCCTEFD